RYDLTFDGVTSRQGPNYRELAAHFTVRRLGDIIGVMEPAKRSFPSRGTATTETALMTRGFSQLYLSLGDPNPDGSLAVRLYYKPLVLLIWFGAVVMVIGGALSLSDRRLRVGAPKPARSKAALSPDLRILVRERLQAGESDQQVINFLVARYGEFVLLRPRFSWHTALLWLAPGAVLLIGACGVLVLARRYRAGSERATAEREKL